jgi:pullulanase/glycogen debranching enzyme
MSEADWSDGSAKAIAFLLSGEPGHYHLTKHGKREPDDSFLAMLNASAETVEFVLPQGQTLRDTVVVCDTSVDDEDALEGAASTPAMPCSRAPACSSATVASAPRRARRPRGGAGAQSASTHTASGSSSRSTRLSQTKSW